MFTEMLDTLRDSRMPDQELLRKRFDFAVTKKMGIISLPSAFWMGDQKINPRTDHLFWAALLLRDRQRIDLAFTVLSVELAEKSRLQGNECLGMAARKARDLVRQLLDEIADPEAGQQLEQELKKLVPEWFAQGTGDHDERT